MLSYRFAPERASGKESKRGPLRTSRLRPASPLVGTISKERFGPG